MVEPCLLNIDLEKFVVEARYNDELSRFRAKKRWITLFKEIYLLEPKQDFAITSFTDSDRFFYYLRCSFKTQVGRFIMQRICSELNSPALKTLKVAHYSNFPEEVKPEQRAPQKSFLLKLLQYFQAG